MAAFEEEETVVTITVSKSLKVLGKVRIVDTEGNLILETEKCSFCRCGQSKKQPWWLMGTTKQYQSRIQISQKK